MAAKTKVAKKPVKAPTVVASPKVIEGEYVKINNGKMIYTVEGFDKDNLDMVKLRSTSGATQLIYVHINALTPTTKEEVLELKKEIARSSRADAPKRTDVPQAVANGLKVKNVGFEWRSKTGHAIVHISAPKNGKGEMSTDRYFVTQVASDIFRFMKLEADRTTEYMVWAGKHRRCSCEGYKAREVCRHVEALDSIASDLPI